MRESETFLTEFFLQADDILKSCARIIQDTLDDNNYEALIRSRVLV